MKRIILILIVSVLTFSCTDMLEQINPTGPTGDDFFANETELNYAVISVYAGLSSGNLYAGNFIGLEQLADNIYTGSSLTDGSTAPWCNFSFDPSNSGVYNVYHDLYIAINRANIVISKIEEVPDLSEQDKKNYLGQVHFIRGYSYFLLTLLYRDVPVITEPVDDPAGTYISKSTAPDIYDLVISDLKFAEQNCPEIQGEKGRVTSWAAKGMLTKVYMFGADELGKPDWYSMAEEYASEIVQSGKFSLYNDPEKTPTENLLDIFDLANEMNTDKEEVFYLQHYNNGGSWGNGDVATNMPMQLNARQNRNLRLWGYGFGYVYESNANIWEEGDARKDYTLWFTGEDVIVDGEVLGQYDQTAQARTNAKPNGMCLQKFWWQENFKKVNGQSDLNWPILRYADVLLLHTEADLMSDGTLSAAGLESFNLVRNRAGLESLTAEEVDRDRILQERHVELFGELHRWFDLMRTKTAEREFAKVSAGDTDGDDTEKLGFNPTRNYKFPLPQRALDRNPELVQHPEWSGE
ncbi:RagB/SusD family nutrient uptake outer membrane protein [uncultured Draconibacterium sp.]|uniref:RagB/SusD family nutrient uptake outer membrane protein n=1 Tax=uncultured Draconibacterium sp. TaxID=1573823 RepID=UPI0029C751A7|nr:RagB/SusD family nutrient uptake outer membrane protein [uncultured Draconibacterium sp.]